MHSDRHLDSKVLRSHEYLMMPSMHRWQNAVIPVDLSVCSGRRRTSSCYVTMVSSLPSRLV